MIAHSVAKPTLVVNTRVEYIKSRTAYLWEYSNERMGGTGTVV